MKKYYYWWSFHLIAILVVSISTLMINWSCVSHKETIELIFTEGTDMEAVPSPDGRLIALQLWSHIFILDVERGEARPLTNPITPPDEHMFPRWSPDSKFIVFSSLRTDAGLLIIPAAGGQLRQLTDGEFDFWPSWSPDGKTIVFERMGSLYTIPAEGGIPKQLTPEKISASQAAWSPNGKWIAFNSNGRLSIISPEGNSTEQITKDAYDLAPSWSHDSETLFFISKRSGLPQVWSVSLEDKELKELTQESDLYTYAPQWMTGRNVLVYTAGGKIHTLGPDGIAKDIVKFKARLSLSRTSYQRKRPEIHRPGERLPVRGIYRPVSSPDGKSMVFAALGDIWMRHDDGNVEQLTSGSTDDCDPSWSGDGNSICFVSNRTGDYQVWIMEVNGRKLKQVTDIPGDSETPHWHPEGGYIVFTHSSRPPLKIVSVKDGTLHPIMKTTGMNVRPVGWMTDDQSLVYSKLHYDPASYEIKTSMGRTTLEGESLPLEADVPGQAEFTALSPKADTLAYVSKGELWTRHIGPEGITEKVIPGPTFFPNWSGDNQIIFVSSGKLMGVDVNSREVKQIPFDLSYEVAHTGESLLLKNARLLTPEPKEGLWDLYIQNGRLESIKKSNTLSRKADRILDVEGRTVIPGLFDTHSHIFRRFPAEGYLYWGVTSVGGAGGPGHWTVSQQEAIRSGRRLGPRIFAACGFVVPRWMNAFPQFLRVETQAQLERYMDHLLGLGATHVKAFLRRDPWVEAATVSAAHRRGLPVLSHFIRPASVAAGLDRKEHSFYYSLDGYARARMRQDVIEILRKADITVSTTITFPYVLTKKGRVRVSEVLSRKDVSCFLPPAQIERLKASIKRQLSETNALENDQWFESSKANSLAAHNAGVNVIVGTDYSPFIGFLGVHWEMEFLVDAGFSPLDALRAATEKAAAALGLDGQLGIISQGAVADLIVLDADPIEDIRNTQKIYSVIKDGNIINRDSLIRGMKK